MVVLVLPACIYSNRCLSQRDSNTGIWMWRDAAPDELDCFREAAFWGKSKVGHACIREGIHPVSTPPKNA